MMSNKLVSIAEALASLADEHPDRPLLSLGSMTRTAAELEVNSNRLAHYFASLGVKADDLVTIALPNGLQFIESTLAIWKLGATPQPVSNKLPDGELGAIIELADPTLVLGVDSDRVAGRLGLPADFELPEGISDEPHPIRFARYNRAPTSGGSTGLPKLIIDTRPAAVHRDPFLPTDSAVVIPGPLYHTGPFSLATRALLMGNHVTIFERFDPVLTLEAVEDTAAGFLYVVPTMMSRIAKLGPEIYQRFDLSSLETIFHTAAPCPDWLKMVWIEWFGDAVVELYSSTEGAAKFVIRGEEWLKHPGSVGKPMPGNEVRILDDHRCPVPAGTNGLIYLRSNDDRGFIYRGQSKPDSVDGFITVGDLGYVDGEGYLYVSDRRRDLILRGGANIFPAEVEAVIESHPQVRSVAVVGVPDDDLGQSVHAFVDAPNDGFPDSRLSEAELRAWLAERIVAYKRPASYEFVDQPLRDDAGKIRRSTLQPADQPESEAATTGEEVSSPKPTGRKDVVEALIGAATELLLESGLHVSVRDIAARAGVNHGLVHTYFGSKQNLVAAAFGRINDRASRSLRGDGFPPPDLALHNNQELARAMARMALDSDVDLFPGHPVAASWRQALITANPELHDSDITAMVAMSSALGLGWALFRQTLATTLDLDEDGLAGMDRLATSTVAELGGIPLQDTD